MARWITRILIANSLLLFLGGCRESGNDSPDTVLLPEQVKHNTPNRGIALEIENPRLLLRELFPTILGGARNKNLGSAVTESLETPGRLVVVGEETANHYTVPFEMLACSADPDADPEQFDLPSITEYCRFSLSVHSEPQDLVEAYDLALQLCKVTGLETQGFEEWLIEKRYERPLEKSVLANGVSGKTYASIEIRPSFEKARPWYVILSLSFN